MINFFADALKATLNSQMEELQGEPRKGSEVTGTRVRAYGTVRR